MAFHTQDYRLLRRFGGSNTSIFTVTDSVAGENGSNRGGKEDVGSVESFEGILGSQIYFVGIRKWGLDIFKWKKGLFSANK